MSNSFEKQVGDQLFTIETGKLAQQANGAVVVRQGDSMVLVTATMAKPREGIDFFPLTIDFEERLYARGRIPGGFPGGRDDPRRTPSSPCASRPSAEAAVPERFRNEVQIITTPLSADLETPLDIMSIVGASTALSISDIPFNGPIGVTRIGCVDGEFVINPTYQQSDESTLDLVVAGSRDGVLMMEAGASEVTDEWSSRPSSSPRIRTCNSSSSRTRSSRQWRSRSPSTTRSATRRARFTGERGSRGQAGRCDVAEGGKADMSARLGR